MENYIFLENQRKHDEVRSNFFKNLGLKDMISSEKFVELLNQLNNINFKTLPETEVGFTNAITSYPHLSSVQMQRNLIVLPENFIWEENLEAFVRYEKKYGSKFLKEVFTYF